MEVNPPHPPKPDDEGRDLMLKVRNGDMAAFASLVTLHRSSVVATISRMLGGDDGDAEDLAQQAFIRVWKSAPRYEPTAKFTTWLFTIVRNLVYNEIRRRTRRPITIEPTGPEREDGESILDRLGDPDAKSPDHLLLRKELEEAVDKAMALLPENQRLALVLRRHENLPYEEIATVLNLSVQAVKSLLFRARNTMKEHLMPYLQDS
jgi:RNA polymerase sigma-70 factor, ECF subfamily